MGAAYKRVLLKLSGEALAGEKGNGFDDKVMKEISLAIKDCVDMGIEMAIVVGGGNFWRGRSSGSMSRTRADYIGMLATAMNALAVADYLEAIDVPVRVQTAIAMPTIAEPYTRNKSVDHLGKGRVVVFGCGTGNPFCSTDTAAALRAAEVDAEIILKASVVDGVYDSDPNRNPNAKKYDELSIDDVLERGLKVIDGTAASMCRDSHIPIMVFSIKDPSNLVKALSGEKVGTIIKEA